MKDIPEEVVKELYIVQQKDNLTAYDTFQESSHEGPLNAHVSTYGFLTPEEAMKCYRDGKAMMRFAGSVGMYWTYPVKRVLSPRNPVVIDLVFEDQSFAQMLCDGKKEICSRCDGEGKHVNPNIDHNGLSEEQLADDDFRASYFGGQYDVQCEECRGNKIVLTPELEGLPDNIRDAYNRAVKQKDEAEAEYMAERRYFERAHGDH